MDNLQRIPNSRVLTLDELKSGEFAMFPMWFEQREPSLLKAVIFSVNERNDIRFIDALSNSFSPLQDQYGLQFRCWYGYRPTDEERAAKAWDEPKGNHA